MRILFLLLTFSFISSSVFAEAIFDFGGNYSAETLKKTTDHNNTEYFYNASVLFNVDKSRKLNVGWIFFGISQAFKESAVDSTYTSFDMGPAIRWTIDKRGMFSVAAAYGYLAKGTYSSGSTSETWEGTSLFGQFATQFPVIDDKFFIGASLNYYSATYSKKTVSNVESSNDAQKTWIFPMLSMTWRL